MTSELKGPVRIDGSTLEPWDVFERHMGAYLSTMFDRSDTDELTLHVPNMTGGDPCLIVVRTVNQGRGILVSYGWDDAGGDVDDSVELAWRMRMTLEGGYNLPHPQLLTIEASGPASRGAGILGLAPHRDSESDEALRDSRLEELLAYARDRCGVLILELDEDGDIPMLVEGVRFWMRLHHGSPVVGLFTPVVDHVPSRTQAARELNVLNRQYIWSRWVRREQMVWQHAYTSPTSFSIAAVDESVQAFVSNHHEVTSDLVDRLGGTATSS